EAPESVRPGDFARVRIVTARHENTLIVPSIAVFEDRGESVVFVVEDGTAVRRTVTTGFVEGDDTELTEGVAEGERVVVKGQRKLKDGAPVEIPEAPESS
ncbi:MAG: efflux RND transporter periplasmic adaptor subunit, partial [Gemmatimonadota bacterium]|nr:efflux RND transporter periplasmic adaptor subunit [Gemmatimonadota bacterium]